MVGGARNQAADIRIYILIGASALTLIRGSMPIVGRRAILKINSGG